MWVFLHLFLISLMDVMSANFIVFTISVCISAALWLAGLHDSADLGAVS